MNANPASNAREQYPYRLPPIRRARDFRLYGFNGIRYIDLWQNQGRAYWGHNPHGFAKTVKNRLSPALHAPFPHPLFRRVLSRARALFPGYSPLFFADRSSLELFFLRIGVTLPSWDLLEWDCFDTGSARFDAAADPVSPQADDLARSEPAAEPAVRRTPARTIGLWRPDRGVPSRDLVCTVLPLPPRFCGELLLIRDELSNGRPFPNRSPEPLSPVQLACWDYILTMMGPRSESARTPGRFPPLPPLERETRNFTRHGRYLVPRLSGDEYFNLYKYARSKNIIINPHSGGLSILPGYATPGEWKSVVSILDAEPGAISAESEENHE